MILVTGGTGVMGSVLVRRLSAAGKSVRILALPDDPFTSRLDGCNVEIRRGDLCDTGDIAGLCDGVDTVYHLAAVIIAYDDRTFQRINTDATRHLVNEARRAGVGHFVYISSASVVYPRSTAYAQSKVSSEQILRDSGLKWTIIRPTLVYDRRGGQEFNDFLAYLKRFPVVPFIGKGDALKRPVFVDEIIEGLVRLDGNSRSYGKVYNFSGAEAISIRDFARLCLALMGEKGKPMVHLPVWFCRMIAAIMGATMKKPPLRWQIIAGMTQDANLDPVEAIADLGYRPTRVSEQLPNCFPREYAGG